MSLTLLHISDLHFGEPFAPESARALREIVPRLDPDAIVVSGDFTQRARAEEFAEARAFLQKLPERPIVTVPGNHDIAAWRLWERFTRPRALYQQYINAELDQVHHLDHATVVALDSTSPRRRISNGRIHLDQLAFAERAFEDVRESDRARIVVTHHHFAPGPDYEWDWTMPKAKRALDRFTGMGVELILAGHMHRAFIGNSLDIYPGQHRDQGIIIVHCGTTTSRRGRGKEAEKNTFNLVRVDDRVLRITHYMLSDRYKEFLPISDHSFPRAHRGHLAEAPPSPVAEAAPADTS